MYRYTAGKLDWLAAGLPVEGTRAGQLRIVDLANRDVPTCGPGDPAEDVRRRVRAEGWDVAVVCVKEGVVLGLLEAPATRLPGAPRAADVMASAPTTVRPHLAPADLPDAARRQERFLVTTSDGVLVGLVRRATLAEVLDRDAARAA